MDHASVVVYMNRALWGKISATLRSVRVKWNNEQVNLFFYYDGEISEEDHKSAESASTEFISHYPEYKLKFSILRWDYPKPVPQDKGILIYYRREP